MALLNAPSLPCLGLNEPFGVKESRQLQPTYKFQPLLRSQIHGHCLSARSAGPAWSPRPSDRTVWASGGQMILRRPAKAGNGSLLQIWTFGGEFLPRILPRFFRGFILHFQKCLVSGANSFLPPLGGNQILMCWQGYGGERTSGPETLGRHLRWDASGKHLGGIWKTFGKHLESTGRHLGNIWEAYVRRRLRRHLGGIWRADLIKRHSLCNGMPIFL